MRAAVAQCPASDTRNSLTPVCCSSRGLALSHHSGAEPSVSTASADPLENPLAIELRSRLVKAELATRRPPGGGTNPWRDVAGCKVLVPMGEPAAAVHLVGGALVGQVPALVYDKLARALCDAGGFLVVATPYTAELDHGAVAEATQSAFCKAVTACGPAFGFDAAGLVRHAVGHSLGSKLAMLSAAGGGYDDGGAPSRVYLCGFTQATAQDQVGLLESLAEALLRGTPAALAVPGIAAVARRAAQAARIEFTPDVEATLAAAAELGARSAAEVRVAAFGADPLDASMALLLALRSKDVDSGVTRGARVTSIVMPGLGHLAPCAVSVTAEQLGEGAAAAAESAGIGGGGFSLGDESAVDAVAMDAVAFLKGFAPAESV